ncbi:MAG TPA: GxxExxY protein, partial [Gemmatimonadaceae bacterium]
VQRQCILPIVFDGYRIGGAYRIDLLVDRQLVVEVKSVQRILPLHEAQVRTYLRMSGHKVGLVLNFNTVLLRDGIRRISV